MPPRTTVLTHRDVDIAVTDFGGDGPAVLLLHGLAGSSREFLPTAEALSGSFRVLLMDQRGHGESTRRPSDTSREACVGDVVHIIETLLPGQAVTLIGQSMGAHTAMLTAVARPELVHHLIMLEGHPAGEETAERTRSIGQYFASWPVPFADTAEAQEFLGEAPLARAWLQDLEPTPAGLQPRFDPDIMKQVIEAVHDPQWEAWEQLSCRTTAIFGEHGMFSADQQSELVRRRPSTQHVVIPGAGHDAHLESPQAWTDLLREHLSPPVSSKLAARAAWVGTEIFSPPALIAMMLASLAVVTDPHWIVTTVVSVIAFAVVPQAVAVVMAVRGRASDKFIVHRRQRHLFYGIVMVSTLLGAGGTVMVTESPWVRWACLIAVTLSAVVAIINIFFKISLHALISALAAVVIASAFTWWLLLVTVPVWLLVVWSRIHLRKHSPGEVLAGSLLGLVAAGVLLLGAGIPMG